MNEKVCNPPWIHVDNCDCAARMADEAEDWRDTMFDKWEFEYPLDESGDNC